MAGAEKPTSDDATTVLVRRALAGDPDSLTPVVERLSPVLILQARRRLGAAANRVVGPDDLVNAAWLTVLPKLASLEPRNGRITPVLLRFLGQTILNHANNVLRRCATDARPRNAGNPIDVQHVEDERTGAVSRAVRNEFVESVLEHLEGLTRQDQDVIILRDLEGLSNDEVAESLGITPKAAVMRRQRALQRLRKSLPHSMFDEFEELDESDDA